MTDDRSPRIGYAAHLASLDRWFAHARSQLPPGTIPCARGCSACCHGPFDISPADAALLANAVAALPEPVRDGVRLRAREQLARMADEIPGWMAPWDIEHLPEEAVDAACDALAAAPCPALDAEGSCLIHADRPATCRITGLGMRTPAGDVLENVCPIQETFPVYRALPPFAFDLERLETASERFDDEARAAGWVGTTIAGAIMRAPGS